MPWRETCAMQQRTQLIGDWLSGIYTKAALSRRYGVSRPTVDKWIERYTGEGPAGLLARSSAPAGHPNAVPAERVERIIAAKRSHPYWGPKKVMDWLRRGAPHEPWPADSTAGEILKRAGLVRRRRYRRHVAPNEGPLSHCRAANEVWSVDFKGDYLLHDGQRCYPLTMTDNHNRYLLACRALGRTSHDTVWPWFERVFREHGLPERIRSDNGAPFASLALGGITRLSAWWIRLGIRPERIAPGAPSQNGRHERMHRTLKDAATRPTADNLFDQQRRFDRFVEEYNRERTHEALNRQTPADCYEASPRAYPRHLLPVDYDHDTTVRRVRHNGEMKWRGHKLYVSEVLRGEPVGLQPVDHGLWEIRYSFHLLGLLHEPTMTISPGPRTSEPAKRKPCPRSKT